MELDLREFAQQPRLVDGAWGTLLENRGLPSGMAPDLWNLENPEAIEQVARSYVETGSEIILTNTFSSNRFALESHGAADRVGELARAGVEISRRAAGDDAKVFASIGPTGKIVMMQEISPDDFLAAFQEAARAISEAGPDAIICETFNELEELKLALRAVRQTCDLPVIASMSFTGGPDGTATMMGNTPEQLAQMAEELGANAVGANCGIGPENHLKVAHRLRDATSLPVWIKPNAGVPEIDANGETTFPVGPEEFARYAPRFIQAGTNFVGGCCGTTPSHIEAIRKTLIEGGFLQQDP